MYYFPKLLGTVTSIQNNFITRFIVEEVEAI